MKEGRREEERKIEREREKTEWASISATPRTRQPHKPTKNEAGGESEEGMERGAEGLMKTIADEGNL